MAARDRDLTLLRLLATQALQEQSHSVQRSEQPPQPQQRTVARSGGRGGADGDAIVLVPAPRDGNAAPSSGGMSSIATGLVAGFATGFAVKRVGRIALLMLGSTIVCVAMQRAMSGAYAAADEQRVAAAERAAAEDELPIVGNVDGSDSGVNGSTGDEGVGGSGRGTFPLRRRGSLDVGRGAPRGAPRGAAPPPPLTLVALLGLSPAWDQRLRQWTAALHRVADADRDGVVTANDVVTHAHTLAVAVSTVPTALFAVAFLYGLRRG